MATKRSLKTVWLSTAVLGLIATGSAGAADIPGVWKAEFDTRVGVLKTGGRRGRD